MWVSNWSYVDCARIFTRIVMKMMHLFNGYINCFDVY